MNIGGKKIPNWALYAGGGGIALAGVFYFKSKKKSAGSGTDPNAIDPVTGLPYSQDQQIDPLTGLGYLAEAQQFGSVSAAEAAYSGASGSAIGGGSSGIANGTPSSSTPISGITSGSGTTTTFATNAQWAQQAEADLVNIGYNATDVASAIGRYLGGLTLTTDQANIVGVALAEEGPPPVGTFQIITSPGTPSGGGSGGSGGSGSGSGSGTGSGTPAPSGRLSAPTGLHLTIDGKTGVRLQWNAVPGATGYVAQLKQGGDNGRTVNGPFSVSSPVANFGGLHSGTQYTALIWPSDSADHGGPGSNQPHAEFGFSTPR